MPTVVTPRAEEVVRVSKHESAPEDVKEKFRQALERKNVVPQRVGRSTVIRWAARVSAT